MKIQILEQSHNSLYQLETGELIEVTVIEVEGEDADYINDRAAGLAALEHHLKHCEKRIST